MAALIIGGANEWRYVKFKPIKDFFELKKDKSYSSPNP